jgi:hypothetical protein
MFGKLPADVSKNIIAKKMTIDELRRCLSINKQFRPTVISEIFHRNYFEAIELQCKLLLFWGNHKQAIAAELITVAQQNLSLYIRYLVLFQNDNKTLAYDLIRNLSVVLEGLSANHFKKHKVAPFLSYLEHRNFFESKNEKTFVQCDKYNPLIKMSVSISYDPLMRFSFPAISSDEVNTRKRITGNYSFSQSSSDQYLYKRAYFQMLQEDNHSLEFIDRGRHCYIGNAMILALFALYPIKEHYHENERIAHRHFAEGIMTISSRVKNPVRHGIKSFFSSETLITHLDRAQSVDKNTLELLLERLLKGSNLYDLPEKFAQELFSHKSLTETENIDLISSVVHSKHANTFLTADFIRHCITVEESSLTHPEGLRELLGLQLTNLNM